MWLGSGLWIGVHFGVGVHFGAGDHFGFDDQLGAGEWSDGGVADHFGDGVIGAYGLCETGGAGLLLSCPYPPP